MFFINKYPLGSVKSEFVTDFSKLAVAQRLLSFICQVISDLLLVYYNSICFSTYKYCILTRIVKFIIVLADTDRIVQGY